MNASNFRKFIVLLTIVLFLYFAQAFVVPLLYGVFIAVFLYPICTRLEARGLNRSMAILLSLLFITIVMLLLIGIVYYQYQLFGEELPQILNKLKPHLSSLQTWFKTTAGIQPDNSESLVQNLVKYTGLDIAGLFKTGINGSIAFLFNLVLIPIYTALFLNYRGLLLRFLVSAAGDEHKDRLREIALKTVHSYSSYIKGMAIVYLVVGILNSIGLMILGVKYAILFGMFTAIMTIIPYLGIILSSLLPISMSLLTSDSLYHPIGVVLVFSIVQYLEGNFIYPYVVGKRINVNMLVSLISVIAGGFFWGVSGMVLVLPLVGMLKVMAGEIKDWEALNLLLGDKSSTKRANWRN
jgi:predicted PurR-regulated permease PerM